MFEILAVILPVAIPLPLVGYAAHITLIFGAIGGEYAPEDFENIRRLRKPDTPARASSFIGR